MEQGTEDVDEPNNEFNQEQYSNLSGNFSGVDFSRQTFMAHPVQILPEGYYYTYYVPFQPCNCLDCPTPPPTNEPFYETRFEYAHPPQNISVQMNPYHFYGSQYYSQPQFVNGYPTYLYPTYMGQGHTAPNYPQYSQFPYESLNHNQPLHESGDMGVQKSKEYIVEEPPSEEEDESADVQEKRSVDVPIKVPEKKE